LRFTELAAFTVEFAVSTPSPTNVSAPLFTASPSVTVPPNEIPFTTDRAVVSLLETVPPLNTSVPLPNAPSFPMFNAPKFTVVFPEYVFTPDRVKSPAPAFVNEKPPDNTPDNTTPLAAVSVVLPVRVPSPANVNTPFFVASPNVTAPPNVIPFASVRAVALLLETVPPFITNVPVPNAPSLPMFNAPALTVVPPL
jgi:hypothetical protein